MNTRKKKKTLDRWSDAKKSLRRILEEIAPFKKTETTSVQSTAELWEEDASSSKIAQER